MTLQLIQGKETPSHSQSPPGLHSRGKLLDNIKVDNDLRQRCSMAPALFNLHVCLVVERWKEKVKDVEGVGILLNYKLDEKLFRQYTKNAKKANFLMQPHFWPPRIAELR